MERRLDAARHQIHQQHTNIASDRLRAVLVFMGRTTDCRPRPSLRSSEQMPEAKANLDWTISNLFLSRQQHGSKSGNVAGFNMRTARIPLKGKWLVRNSQFWCMCKRCIWSIVCVLVSRPGDKQAT